MKKNSLFFILSLSLGSLLASCSFGNNTSPIDKYNAKYNLLDNRVHSLSPSIYEVLIPEEYKLVSDDELASMSIAQNPSLGFVFIEEAEADESISTAEYGVFSLIFNKVIVPVSYSSFRLNGPTNNGYYIIGQNVTSGLYDVYDYRGFTVLSSLTNVDNISFTTTISQTYGLIETYNYEGDTVSRIVNEDGTRSEYANDKENSLPEIGDIIDTGRSDLKQYGLDGYYAKIGNGYWRVYKNDGTMVAQYQVPSLSAVIFDKTILYQVSTLLADDASNYDYLSVHPLTGETRKYLLRTYTIEILTGKLTEHTVNYLIDTSSTPSVVYDSEGIMRYGLVKASDITNKRIMNEYAKLYVLNSDGTVHYDASADPAYGAEILSDTRYYNPTTREILDENFTSIASLGYSVTARNYDAQLLTVQASTTTSSVLGAVNFNGVTVVSFAYSSLDLSCLTNGFGYGKGTDLLDYSINPTTGEEVAHELQAGTSLTPYTGFGYLRMVYDASEETPEKISYLTNDFVEAKVLDSYVSRKYGRATDIYFDDFQIDTFEYEEYSKYIVFHLV
ncbi:MAG: hypothetical protein IJ247_05825 [Bacilli bacterium]|nr:hypothetical protein [Bacilli bacterium]